ncbi:hypothetical protein BC829DRAFT_493735 [Chytridium lagenaria]|nr:hypothetical protein BC829DRAFT_493735 [Chytridium lagenaria]
MEFMNPYPIFMTPTLRCPVCSVGQMGGRTLGCCGTVVCHSCYYNTATSSRSPRSCPICRRDPASHRVIPQQDPQLEELTLFNLFRSAKPFWNTPHHRITLGSLRGI